MPGAVEVDDAKDAIEGEAVRAQRRALDLRAASAERRADEVGCR
jgi:hypothetical protein